MLRITQVEEIERMLFYLPALVKQQEERASDFADNVAMWLRQLENVFVENRQYQTASIAMLRSELVAASHGELPAGIAFKGMPSRSRVKAAVAAQALRRASEIASGIVNENRKRFTDAEAVAQQLIVIAIPRGLVIPPDPDMTNTEYLLQLRNRLMHADLENAVLHLEGLVGPNDALVLLDRALALRNVVVARVP
jgi:hypothetical protein